MFRRTPKSWWDWGWIQKQARSSLADKRTWVILKLPRGQVCIALCHTLHLHLSCVSLSPVTVLSLSGCESCIFQWIITCTLHSTRQLACRIKCESRETVHRICITLVCTEVSIRIQTNYISGAFALQFRHQLRHGMFPSLDHGHRQWQIDLIHLYQFVHLLFPIHNVETSTKI